MCINYLMHISISSKIGLWAVGYFLLWKMKIDSCVSEIDFWIKTP
jgi:hypothetical protein